MILEKLKVIIKSKNKTVIRLYFPYPHYPTTLFSTLKTAKPFFPEAVLKMSCCRK